MQIKPIRKRLCLLLAVIFVVGMFTVAPVSAAGNPTSFYSGFETTDPAILVSDNVSAVGVLGQSLLTGIATTGNYRGVLGGTTGNLTTGPVTNYHTPQIRWNSTGTTANGYTGKRTLGFAGRHTQAGPVSAMNKIYEFPDGDEILVTPTTELSYMIAPTFNINNNANNLEFGKYPSQHVCVDLHFTNGKYLSELNCYDSHGVRMDPQSQFEGKCMWEGQWNKVLARIGEVADGLLIDQILVSYANKDGADGYTFEANIDDLRIVGKRSDDPSAQPFDGAFNSAGEIIHPSELTDIRRGSNSSNGAFSRGHQAGDLCAPFGFNFWGPQTSAGGNDPYNWAFSNNTTANKPVFRSIGCNHRPSRWIGDRGNFQFFPNIEATQSSTTMAQGSRGYQFSHDNEIAKSYYYSIVTDNNIKTEITPTTHGLHARATFPAGTANPTITFDAMGSTVTNGFSTAGLADNEMNFIVNHNSNGSQNMYVYAIFDVVPTARTAISGMRSASSYARFPDDTTVVEMRIATSYISAAQAKANCDLEVKATFDETKAASRKAWDDLLTGVLVKEFGAPVGWNGTVDTLPLKSLDGLVTFYSNLVKLYSWPNYQHENTGTAANPIWQYRTPYGGSIKNGPMVINNGFWDTYKATWSAYGLLIPDFNGWMLDGLVNHYMDSGFVPRWSAPAGTNSMVGTSSDVVFGTAAMRGLSFDTQRAFESAVKAATVNNTGTLTNGGRTALTTSIFAGFTSGSGTGTENLSWSLEGYINDFGISQMARLLGYTDMAAYYSGRAVNYIHNWNPYEKTDKYTNVLIPGGWLRQRNTDNTTTGAVSWGQTDAAFDPYAWRTGYTETNAFDMVVTTVDGQGMANLLGGLDGLEKRLDVVFTSNPSWTNGGYSNIHEQLEHAAVKMGQYGHSNQPAHQVPYYYNFTNAPWKTQLYVREILDRLYTNWECGFGYCGDEDNGEMSGTAVMSALGFGSTSLGWDEFYLTAPYFPHIVITRDNGTVIDIKAPGVSMTNKFIQSMKLNGVDYNKTFISSADLYGKSVNTLEYVMGPAPSTWGTAADSKPHSLTAPGVTPQPLNDLTKAYSNRTNEGDAVISSQADGTAVTNPNNLFDNSMTTNATTTFASGDWFGYRFGTPQVVHLYTVSCGSTPAQNPRSWVLEASNDGNEWDILDTRTNVTFGFDTRSLGPVGTPVTKTQALTQGTVWTACGSGYAQNNTQSTMPFGIINNKAYTHYRVRVTANGGNATLAISELEFMGFKDPSTAYLVSALKKQADGTYDLYEADAENFAVNLPRRPVAEVTVSAFTKDGAFLNTVSFGPNDFSVPKIMPLAAGLGSVDTAKLEFRISSDDPSYNAIVDNVNYGLVFEASLDSAITAGASVTASLRVRNLLNTPKSVNAFLALYNSRGAMADLAGQLITVPVGGVNQTMTKAFSIPAGAVDYAIKAFFWDIVYVPYAQSIDFAQ